MAKKKKATASKNGSAKKKKATPTVTSTNVPIKRHVSPELKSIFSNHAVVRAEQGDFHLFFFDAQAPISPEAEDGSNTNLSHVDAHCVSRVTVPMHVVPGLITALQTIYDSSVKLATALDQQRKKP